MSLEEIQNLQDVSEGLENLIKKSANSCNNIPELINAINTKRYTQSRIQRILLYSILNITKKDIQNSKKITPYVRVLGFNENGKHLISEIMHNNPKLELITSVKQFFNGKPNPKLLSMLQKDIWATDVYTLGFRRDSHSNLDFTKKIEFEQ